MVTLWTPQLIMSTKVLLLLFLFSFCFCDPIVELPDGTIKGKEVLTHSGLPFFAFQGIPYAAPPIGSLRFQAPQPPNKWNGTLETTDLFAVCFQLHSDLLILETEDCLFLNVYTPQLPTENSDGLPVMIFIYGGGFSEGTSQMYYSDLLVEEDVILVTFNYRLGIFGFLSTEDEVIPGNAALKDQQMVIKWCHDNIHLFGGNPDKITIFGESAGAASVGYQLLNQNNQNLIKGAILQSGTALASWSLQRGARERAFHIATSLNSTFENLNDSQVLLDFLQNLDARTLEEAELNYENIHQTPENHQIYQGFFWAPVVETKNPSAFLTKKMYGLMLEGSFLQVPVMIGINSEESLTLTGGSDELRSLMESYDKNSAWIVPKDMHIAEDSAVDVGITIRNFYTAGSNLADNLGIASKFCSDNCLNRAVIKHAQLSSKFVPTYFYQLSYDGPLGHNDIHYDGADYVGHGEDVYYLLCFVRGCDGSLYPEADIVTRERMVNLWTNFAKYQNPTPDDSGVVWPTVDNSNGDFVFLNIKEDLVIENLPKWESFQFWDDLYQNSGYSDFDTY